MTDGVYPPHALSVNNRKREWLLTEGIQEYTINLVINYAIRNQVSEYVRQDIDTYLREGILTTYLWDNL